MATGLAAALIWFVGFSAGHIVVFHFALVALNSRLRALLRLLATAVVGCLITSAIVLLKTGQCGLPGDCALGLVSGPLLLLALFVVYVPCYYPIATSLSIQTLIAIERSETGALALSQLTDRSILAEMLRIRLESLVANGNLRADGDRFYIAPSGRRLSRIFMSVKTLWKLGPGG